MCLLERNTDRRGRPLAALRSATRVRERRLRNRSAGLTMAVLLLAFLAQDDLLVVTDALALVRLRRSEGAQLRGGLRLLLAIGAEDGDRGRGLALHLDVVRHGVLDVVAVAELPIQNLAVPAGAVADAVDHQLPGEAPGHALDHVGA